jgi:hypothetical protein
LFVDSSKYAIAGVLCQPDDNGDLHPVSFLSRKLTPRESLWQVHDQELYAIVSAFTEWRAWLIDTNDPVTVMSDHANLRYFMTNQRLTDRQARWASFLTSFHFVIKHVSGKNNPADAPTRRPDYVSDDGVGELSKVLFQEKEADITLMDSVKELADVVAAEDSSAALDSQIVLPANPAVARFVTGRLQEGSSGGRRRR